MGGCGRFSSFLPLRVHSRTDPISFLSNAQIIGQLQTVLEEMVGKPGVVKPPAASGSDKKEDKAEGKPLRKKHVKVMILNSGNIPMFLNMMCSARRGVSEWARAPGVSGLGVGSVDETHTPLLTDPKCVSRKHNTPQGLDFKKDLLIFAAEPSVEETLRTLGYRTYRHAAFGDFSPAEHMA